VLLISRTQADQTDSILMRSATRRIKAPAGDQLSDLHVGRLILLEITYRYHRFSIECEQLELETASVDAATAYNVAVTASPHHWASRALRDRCL